MRSSEHYNIPFQYHNNNNNNNITKTYSRKREALNCSYLLRVSFYLKRRKTLNRES